MPAPTVPVLGTPAPQKIGMPAPSPAAFMDWDDFGPAEVSPAPSEPAGTITDDFELPDYDPALSQRLGDAPVAAG